MYSFDVTLITALTSFVATNIDDLVVLTLFFSQCQRRWPIVVGQYLGFSVIIAISLIGYFGGHVLPHEWIKWLGLVPIVIGIRKLFLGNDVPSQRSGSDLWSIALITFSNGGDNIGIYTPLFAVSSAKQVFTFIAIFYVLIPIWCAVGYLLTRHHVVAKCMQKYGYRIVPFVFIGIGLYILLS